MYLVSNMFRGEKETVENEAGKEGWSQLVKDFEYLAVMFIFYSLGLFSNFLQQRKLDFLGDRKGIYLAVLQIVISW